mgnify:CR=1 FL=1
MALQLKWVKCSDHWCSFQNVNLASVATEGVYVIWEDGGDNRAVRVGQGDIAKRLAQHRLDPAITQYGQLRVTWAAVAAQYRDGVERYLAENYSPLVGDRFPAAQPIAVNLLGQ